MALDHILEHGSLTIQHFERLCPKVNRRSLQRDMKGMPDKRQVVSEGSINKLVYRMKDTDWTCDNLATRLATYYWLEVNAMIKLTIVRENRVPYGAEKS